MISANLRHHPKIWIIKRVVTTIKDPVLLEGYRANFEAYGRLSQIKIIVIPDRKTPPAAYERCAPLRLHGLLHAQVDQSLPVFGGKVIRRVEEFQQNLYAG